MTSWGKTQTNFFANSILDTQYIFDEQTIGDLLAGHKHLLLLKYTLSHLRIANWASLVGISANARDSSSIPGMGRSPREENGNLLQYSCLENPMGRGAWRATVCGVAKSQT